MQSCQAEAAVKADGVMVLKGPWGSSWRTSWGKERETLSVLSTGVPHPRRCPGETLLPVAAGSTVKGYMVSRDLPPQFISAVHSCFRMFYLLNFLQCYSANVCNGEWEIHWWNAFYSPVPNLGLHCEILEDVWSSQQRDRWLTYWNNLMENADTIPCISHLRYSFPLKANSITFLEMFQ